MIIDPVGVKNRVKFGDSMSNCSRAIRLPHFVTNDCQRHLLLLPPTVLRAGGRLEPNLEGCESARLFYDRAGAAGSPDSCALARDKRANFKILDSTVLEKFHRKQYIRLFFLYKFRPEVDNDVISGTAVDIGYICL